MNKITELFSKIKSKFVASKAEKNKNYISSKESRSISRENIKITREYEKKKKIKNVSEDTYTTVMRDNNNILEFDNLHTYFFTDIGVSKAVNGVTFDIPQGATVGVVGESGCGKSITSFSAMQLVQAPQGQIVEGSIRFKATTYDLDEHGHKKPIYEYEEDKNGEKHIKYVDDIGKNGKVKLDNDGNAIKKPLQATNYLGAPAFEMKEVVYDIAKMPTDKMRDIRGSQISMIFQEPMTSLNPVFTIGYQLDEVVLLHVEGITKAKAKERTIEMLQLVGIAMPHEIYRRYPHELSGGMRQRVVIAMALSCSPKLIIADEPTTALDVTIQAQILDLLRDIKHKISGSIMLITHDLGVIAEMAEYVVVMYAGKVIEAGTAEEVFNNPMHPYTIGLQKSKPIVGKNVDKLYSIPGKVPNPVNMPNYCYFKDRCRKCIDKCSGDYPGYVQVSSTHRVACHLYTKNEGEEA